MRRADIEVPSLPVDVNSWGRPACYPRGSFYPIATALPPGTVGSLSPSFDSARLVGLAVKLPYAFTLFGWFPFSLREPLGASVTLSEATAPVKLPTWHCPAAGSRPAVRAKT